nr:hypothetical protein [Tanacetum cinerariifolium]
MEKGQSIGTPMATKPKLDADLSEKLVDQTDYHSKIRSLVYLKSNRPDIVQTKQDCIAMSSEEAEYVALSVSRDQQEEAGIHLNAEQADLRDDTDDESDDQELEAHYMYMAKLQQVSPDVVDSGPIFDKEPKQK